MVPCCVAMCRKNMQICDSHQSRWGIVVNHDYAKVQAKKFGFMYIPRIIHLNSKYLEIGYSQPNLVLRSLVRLKCH